ncbi:MAG: DNA polymerase III subunit delta [Thomasclavelia sp.]|nr:DNA polymerase III subunit delta [Thomasclavelia sp.]
MIYIISGEERLLMDTKLKELKEKLKCNEENMNYTEYDLENDSLNDAYLDAITLPFFTDNKMVVIKNPTFLTTQKVKTNKEDADIFLKMIEEIDDSVNLVIFNFNNNFDKKKKTVKQLLKVAKMYNFEQLSSNRISDACRKSIRARGATIDDDALDLLIARKGENLMSAASEVEKLCLYTKHIDLKAVDSLVTKPLDENVFDLTGAILKRDLNKAYSVYNDLKVLNEEPVKLIILIANSIRISYQVKVLSSKGYSNNEMARMLKTSPQRIYYVLKEIGAYNQNELLKLLDQLSNLDIKIKTGQIDKNIGLELFLMKL